MLPLEDPTTTSVDAARRWLTIYEQRQVLLGESNGDADAETAAVGAGAAFWRERVLSLVGLDIDPERRVVRGPDYEVRLTRREMELLTFLAQHTGRSFSDQVLATRAWGGVLSGDQVRIYIRRIRAKLEGTTWQITSRRGYGYTLERVESEHIGHPTSQVRPDGLERTRAKAMHAIGRAHSLLATMRMQLDETAVIAKRLRESVRGGESG